MNAEQMIALAEEMSLDYSDGYYQRSKGQDSDGLYRSVILRDGYAFKAIKSTVNPDCIAEWDFYTLTTDEIRAMLAKPVYVSRNGRVIVVEEVRVGVYPDDEQALAELERSLRRLSKETYGFDYFCDFGTRNMGFTQDGRAVMIDWANFLHRFADYRNKQTSDYENRNKYDKLELATQLLELQRLRDGFRIGTL